MKNKVICKSSPVTAALFASACLAWPRTDAATSAVQLDWSPGQYATISGNILTVDVPAEAADGTFYGARASFDLAQFEGRTLSASVLTRADGISEPERSTYGIKVMLVFQDPETDAYRYPQAPCPAAPFEWRTLEVVDTVSGGARSERGRLWLGLQGVSGRVQFDLSTAEVVNGDPLFPRVNGDLTCAYTDRVRNAPQKRGVMLPGKACTEGDFQTLCQWGATLVRYQMTDGPKPTSGETTETYLARYREWLGGKLDHLDHDVLPWAVRYGMEVAVDLHTPPGGSGSSSMLDDEALATEFVSLWRNIATRFKGRAGIYGYDLCNELNQTGPVLYDYWTIQRLAAEAIRAIDPETPIIIESNKKDSPLTFSYLSPLNLTNVIYELHMYEPGSFTHQGVAGEENFEQISYPREGRDKTYLQQVLMKARAFEAAHGAKIYVGEFSAPCWADGVETYLGDLIDIFGEYGWDWTYHAFREWSGWSVEHEPVSLGITPDCFRYSPDNPRKRVLLNGISGPASGTLGYDPQITAFRVEQDKRCKFRISYHLDEPAYITMDVLTNGVSIGGQNISFVTGDCNQLVPAGDRSIVWDARSSWPDQKSDTPSISVSLKAWARDVPPDVMDVNLETKSIAYYASEGFLPQGGLTNDIYRTTHLVMKKVSAAGMTFTMGSPEDETSYRGSEAQHLVSLTNDYYLAIYETTRKQFATMGCKVHATYGEQETPYDGDDPDQTPIGRILYNNLRGSVTDGIDWPSTGSTADGYIATMRAATGLALDLPTEAQWEFACRAGTTTAIYTGKGNTANWNNSDVEPIAWFSGTSGNKPHAVGGKQPNAWGFYDMYGNAWEWCLDWYDDYDTSVQPTVDPKGPSSGTARVLRSSWYQQGAQRMRSAARTSQAPGTADTKYGFRLCVTLP